MVVDMLTDLTENSGTKVLEIGKIARYKDLKSKGIQDDVKDSTYKKCCAKSDQPSCHWPQLAPMICYGDVAKILSKIPFHKEDVGSDQS